MKVGYIIVSTDTQNTDRQYNDLKQYNIEKFFKEKASGKNIERPILKELLNFIRAGDILYIESFSRLARNTKDLLNIIELLKKKKVKIISQKENLDSETPTGKMMITMIAAIATFERDILLERQKEGIAIAKANGKYAGRKKVLPPNNFEDLYTLYLHRQIATKKELAKKCHVSMPILYRFIKDYNEKENTKKNEQQNKI